MNYSKLSWSYKLAIERDRKMKKIILLLSGGPDSSTCLAILKDTHKDQGIIPVFFNYGQACYEAEKESVENLCQYYDVNFYEIDFPFYNEMGFSLSNVVPFRNGIFISMASALAEYVKASKITIGVHGGDKFLNPDCRPDFLNAMKQAVRIGT